MGWVAAPPDSGNSGFEFWLFHFSDLGVIDLLGLHFLIDKTEIAQEKSWFRYTLGVTMPVTLSFLLCKMGRVAVGWELFR